MRRRLLLRRKPYRLRGPGLTMTVNQATGLRLGERVWQYLLGNGDVLITKQEPEE